MARRDPLVALRQMRDHANEAITLAAGRRRRDLDADRMLLHALTRLVEIVGEAADRVPDEVQARHGEIPWADVVGMRHRLSYGYDEVDLDVLWATVAGDLPDLVAALDRILAA